MATEAEKRSIFPSARDDAEAGPVSDGRPQLRSPSYRLAYTDQDFLLRDELRPVRFQLELLKPEMGLMEHDIESTIVVFGSARIPKPEVAAKAYAEAERKAKRSPSDAAARRALEFARHRRDQSRYYDEARHFARIASEAGQFDSSRHFVVVTGGGPGIMEAANRGAHEVDAVSVGLNISLPEEQGPNDYITPELCFRFHYFALRKMHFLLRARALVIFPGGFGTLDELFDALTLIQTRKIQPIPVLLFGEAYWRRIINFEAMVEEGVISPEDIDIFQYVESAEQAWKAISAYYRFRPASKRRRPAARPRSKAP